LALENVFSELILSVLSLIFIPTLDKSMLSLSSLMLSVSPFSMVTSIPPNTEILLKGSNERV